MLTVYDRAVPQRMILGTARYPAPQSIQESVARSGAGMVTVAVRRESGGGRAGQAFWDLIRRLDVAVLPNTAGCQTAQEAVTTAQMAAELFETDHVKLETVGDEDTLQPDPYALLEAAEKLVSLGFKVWPYMTEDLVVAERLVAAGCEVLMPWASPIGSARGLNNPFGLQALRARFPETPIIADAGLGVPSHAATAMEMGLDGILLNTAIAQAGDPPAMAEAFARAVSAGRQAYEAGPMPARDMAQPSTPVAGQPFWHSDA